MPFLTTCKINKKASLMKRKMNVIDKGAKSTSGFHLPVVRSSVELLRHFRIKQEKISSHRGGANMTSAEGPCNNQNEEKGSNQPLLVLGSQKQFNLSNFTAIGSASSDKVIHPTKQRACIEVIEGYSSRFHSQLK